MNLPNALQVNSRAAKVGKAFNYLGAKKGVTDLSRCYGCCNKVLGSRNCSDLVFQMLPHKGQLISKAIYGLLNSPKK